MASIEQRFNQFVNGLTAREQEQVAKLMEVFLATREGPDDDDGGIKKFAREIAAERKRSRD